MRSFSSVYSRIPLLGLRFPIDWIVTSSSLDAFCSDRHPASESFHCNFLVKLDGLNSKLALVWSSFACPVCTNGQHVRLLEWGEIIWSYMFFHYVATLAKWMHRDRRCSPTWRKPKRGAVILFVSTPYFGSYGGILSSSWLVVCAGSVPGSPFNSGDDHGHGSLAPCHGACRSSRR